MVGVELSFEKLSQKEKNTGLRQLRLTERIPGLATEVAKKNKQIIEKADLYLSLKLE